MDRRSFLRRTSLALAGGLVLGNEAMEMYERLTHRKVWAMGAMPGEWGRSLELAEAGVVRDFEGLNRQMELARKWSQPDLVFDEAESGYLFFLNIT